MWQRAIKYDSSPIKESVLARKAINCVTDGTPRASIIP